MELEVYDSMHEIGRRTYELTPKVNYERGAIREGNYRIGHRILTIQRWKGELAPYYVLLEGEYRQLYSVLSADAIEISDLTALLKYLPRTVNGELCVIKARVSRVLGFGYALYVDHVIGAAEPLKNGNLIYCSNNVTLTQSVELVLAVDNDRHPVLYKRSTERFIARNKKFNRAAAALKAQSFIDLKTLFSLTNKEIAE